MDILACPYCSEPCMRDVVPVPGGLARIGPFGCMACGAEEMTTERIDYYGIVRFDAMEARTGWLRPRRGHDDTD